MGGEGGGGALSEFDHRSHLFHFSCTPETMSTGIMIM